MTKRHNDYMADHLEGMAKALDAPGGVPEVEFKRAVLRGLSHAARQTDDISERVAELEKRGTRMDLMEARLTATEAGNKSLTDQLKTHQDRAAGAWWLACKVAAVMCGLAALAVGAARIFGKS